MKILAFDHVQIAMPNGQEHKARAFYDKLLGFTDISKPTAPGERG
jgi:4-hydroxyphenylpyruvate dioxygenase-like putative hemolysin